HAPCAANSSCISSALSCIDVRVPASSTVTCKAKAAPRDEKSRLSGPHPSRDQQKAGRRSAFYADGPVHTVYSLLLTSTNPIGKGAKGAKYRSDKATRLRRFWGKDP